MIPYSPFSLSPPRYIDSNEQKLELLDDEDLADCIKSAVDNRINLYCEIVEYAETGLPYLYMSPRTCAQLTL